jgi:hypothetical protein
MEDYQVQQLAQLAPPSPDSPDSSDGQKILGRTDSIMASPAIPANLKDSLGKALDSYYEAVDSGDEDKISAEEDGVTEALSQVDDYITTSLNEPASIKGMMPPTQSTDQPLVPLNDPAAVKASIANLLGSSSSSSSIGNSGNPDVAAENSASIDPNSPEGTFRLMWEKFVTDPEAVKRSAPEMYAYFMRLVNRPAGKVARS